MLASSRPNQRDWTWLLSLGLTTLWGFWPFVLMPIQMAAGMTAAVLTGVIFGGYPARRAAELPPVQCLRAE
jgi:ABC-type antimicrobial peptide transport system permease subunit